MGAGLDVQVRTPAARIGRWIDATAAEGPFLRSALWFLGCPIRCPGCCNPELFEARGGLRIGPTLAADRLARARAAFNVEGVTFVGGEPLAQPAAVAWLSYLAASLGLGVIVFTGFDLPTIEGRPELRRALRWTDTVIAGPYRANLPERRRPFVGSSNQRIVHRTPRYRNPDLWSGPSPVEVRVGPGGGVEIVGRPDRVRRVSAVIGHAHAHAPSPVPDDVEAVDGPP
ncbi:MAG: 4Fe-4S cluster-binding domain-containing protein [Deltaproteobacteria bacterium]|nr:MAG: 4Fe-4S cluster-binding domain-containing protein [Deltaproteobacteria bacterium]